MSDLENDIDRAKEILNYSSSRFNKMTNYSRIYQNTTENVKGYMKYFNGNNNSSLVPVSSGDQLVEAIICNYDDITCFDINRLAKYFVKLKIVAISNFSKSDYIRFMYDDMFNEEMYCYLRYFLDDDTREFWGTLLKKFGREKIKYYLFRRLAASNNSHLGTDFYRYCACNYTSLFDDDNYRKVQDRIVDIDINYVDSDIIDLPNVLDDKYDFINLTNIYQYFNQDVFSGNDKVYCDAVNELIKNNLNKNGKVLVSYLYRCCLNDLYRYRDKPLVYARIINFIKNTPSLKNIHDKYSRLNTVSEKFSFFRKFQLLRWLDDSKLSVGEVLEFDLGESVDDKDLVLIYKKSSRK